MNGIMNKTVLVITIALIGSFFAARYFANKPYKNQSKSANILIVGTNSEYAPFSYMENNTLSGFDIDLANEVASRLGKTVEWQDMPFDALIPALQTGSIHVIATGITPTAERAQKVNFTAPYLKGDPLLIVTKAETPLKTIEQLTGKLVAVNEGFTADYYMAKIKGPELIRFASPLESFMALDSNRVDALVSAQNNVKPLIESYGAQKFSVSVIPETSDEYALAVSKQYPELLLQIQATLQEMHADGTIENLKKKWKLN